MSQYIFFVFLHSLVHKGLMMARIETKILQTPSVNVTQLFIWKRYYLRVVSFFFKYEYRYKICSEGDCNIIFKGRKLNCQCQIVNGLLEWLTTSDPSAASSAKPKQNPIVSISIQFAYHLFGRTCSREGAQQWPLLPGEQPQPSGTNAQTKGEAH